MTGFALTTPDQISMWRYLSAVSQLTLEIETGMNYYGRTSVYKGIRLNMIPGLPPRATLRNKLVAMGCLLEALPDEQDNEVLAHGRRALDAKLEELGLVLTPV